MKSAFNLHIYEPGLNSGCKHICDCTVSSLTPNWHIYAHSWNHCSVLGAQSVDALNTGPALLPTDHRPLFMIGNHADRLPIMWSWWYWIYLHSHTVCINAKNVWFLAEFSFIYLPEKTIQWCLGSSAFLSLYDTVTLDGISNSCCNLCVPFYAWVLCLKN